MESKFSVSPDVGRYNSGDEDNVTQVRTFYTQVLNKEERQRLCQNMAGALKGAQLFIQKRMVENLKAVHPDYGNSVQTLLDKYNADAQKTVRQLTVMNPAGYPAETVTLQGRYDGNPGRPGGSTVVQHTTVNIVSDPPPPPPPKDHIIWSLCCFVYSNPCCLGLAALIFSIKARDRKMVGDMDGAQHYASTARCLNICATVLVSIIIGICLIVTIVTASRATYTSRGHI
ncbi:Catalase [Larimichthys crocea]|uniref:Uncharacterized protein n=1 Tax=Larimichthys crocea TaxID=215358 RepID=A0ACD3QG08_LARCR|nr:Catalase [Larimichthys crocea]